MIEMSLEKMKGINELGRKNIWTKAKIFPLVEEPDRKSVIEIFVKTNNPKRIKFKSL
jgi:hypothetical protein